MAAPPDASSLLTSVALGEDFMGRRFSQGAISLMFKLLVDPSSFK